MFNKFLISWPLVLTLSLGILSGCSTTQKSAIKEFEKHASFDGFRLFESPRTSHKPGYIFKIDEYGTAHKSYDFSDQYVLKPSGEVPPRISREKSANFGLNFLPAALVKSSADFNVNSRVATKFNISTANRYEFDDTQEKDVRKKFGRLVNEGEIDFDQRFRYYLIRAVISATNVDLRFEKNLPTEKKEARTEPKDSDDAVRGVTIEVKAEARPINGIPIGSVTVTHKQLSQNEFAVKFNGTKEFNVMYKAIEMYLGNKGISGAEFEARDPDATVPLRTPLEP